MGWSQDPRRSFFVDRLQIAIGEYRFHIETSIHRADLVPLGFYGNLCGFELDLLEIPILFLERMLEDAEAFGYIKIKARSFNERILFKNLVHEVSLDDFYRILLKKKNDTAARRGSQARSLAAFCCDQSSLTDAAQTQLA